MNRKKWINHCQWLKKKYGTCDGSIPKNDFFLTHFEVAKLISDSIPENSTIITGSSGLAIEAFYVAYEPKKIRESYLLLVWELWGMALPAFIGALESLEKKK